MYQHQDGKNVERTEAEFPSAARVRTPSGIVRMRGKYGIPGCHPKTGTDSGVHSIVQLQNTLAWRQ